MKRILVGLAVLASTIPASAADLWVDQPLIIPESASAFDWSGFYAGIFAGYAGGRATSTSVPGGIVTNIDANGGMLGGTVGGNAQFDMFVLGLEGDVAWANIKGSAACTANPAFTCNGSVEWLGSAKARAGVAFDNLLLFATAGVAAGGFNASNTPKPNNITGSYSGTAWGWTVGAGAEYAVTDAISIKAEYAYYDLGPLRSDAGTVFTTPVDLTAKTHTVKVGVNYHF